MLWFVGVGGRWSDDIYGGWWMVDGGVGVLVKKWRTKEAMQYRWTAYRLIISEHVLSDSWKWRYGTVGNKIKYGPGTES